MPSTRGPRLSGAVAQVWDRSWTSPWAWTLIVVSDVWLGMSYILGGPERLSSPSFAGLRAVDTPVVTALAPLTDQGDAIGAVFVVAGLVAAVGPFVGRRTLAGALWVLVVLHLVLLGGFTVALLHEPPVPPYPPPPPLAEWPRPATSAFPTYLFIFGAHLINAAVLTRLGPTGRTGGVRA